MLQDQLSSTDTRSDHLVRDLLGEALELLRRHDGAAAEHFVRKAWNVVGPAEGTLRAGGLAPWQARRLRSYLSQHFMQEISVKQAASLIARSSSLFCRSFRVSFGCSFHQYIIRLRLQRACRLMLTSDARLAEIALDSGLSDQAHLSRLFKRAFGESPAAWRRRYSDGNDGIISPGVPIAPTEL